MNSTVKSTVQTVRQMIDRLVPGDLQASRQILHELSQLCCNLPAVPAELCDSVAEAAQSDWIAQPDERILVMSLYELFAALEKLVDQDDTGIAELAEATTVLKSVIAPEMNGVSANLSVEVLRRLLNEAATALIDLGDDDDVGWTELCDMFQQIVARPDCIGRIKQILFDAASAIEQFRAHRSQGGASPRDSIGDAIEAAIQVVDDISENNGVPPIEDASAESSDQIAMSTGSDESNALQNDPELIEAFMMESTDLIANAEESLLRLERQPDDRDALDQVFRSFHTIKGTSAFLRLNVMSALCHRAETLLSEVRSGTIGYGGVQADLALRALDMLKALIDAFQNAMAHGSVPEIPVGYDALMEDFDGAPAEPEKPSTRDWDAAHEVVIAESSSPATTPTADSPADLAEDKNGAVPDPPPKRTPVVMDSSIRVGTQRLDRMIDMVGELVVAHAMVAQDSRLLRESNIELLKKVRHTSKIVRELQHLSMLMRMIPLKTTFRKMERLVRDLAKETGKSVQLITQGADTEIDRNMVNVINDPLMHMIRNAVDHGIEAPAVRQTAGKPETGEIRLYAYHSAGSVVVEIADDGQGLDREAIQARALERGLIDTSIELNDEAIWQLIFTPGFSTSRTVSDISGRGVGMDVVKRNIEELNGQIEIQSKPGRGSLFKMSLPLTLAIIDGMVIRVVNQRYVIPTLSIVKSLQLRADEVETIYQRGRFVTIQNRLIPLFALSGLFQLAGSSPDIQAPVLVIVVESEGRRAGLIIDELVGRQQIVIKSLGESMRDIPGVSGGAIMPDGRVGLILDVSGLVKLANR